MHSSSEGEEADIAVVSSLAFGNELDFVVGAGGPWTLQACGVPLFIPLIDNLNSSKIDIVYFLVPKVWIEKLKLEINYYADNLNSKIEIIFVELEETVKFLGDALRYFMSYNILNNNFLLISNPMITTANFDHIMKSFKDSCAQDSAIVITPYIYEMPTIVDQLEYITSIIHNKKHIIKMKVASKNSELVLPLEYFVQNEEFEINMKVPKCPILACKPSVLIYFEDNFDCETIEGLVNWIVSKEEIIQQKVEYKKLEHYTVPIHCCEMYHQIVRDLMCFFLPKYHPLNYAYYDNKAQYSAMNKSINIITEKKSKISKESTIVKGFLFLNSNSVIGSNCKIESTMVMKNCIIEDNCSIKNCIIMDNCHIKNDSKLENLIIGHGNEISLSKLDGLNLKLIPPEKIVDSTSITQIMEVMTKTLATFNISLDQLDISEYQEINYGIESDFKAKSQMDQSKEFVTKCVELLKKSRSNNAVHNAAIDIVVILKYIKIFCCS
ncbi:MAG: Translation initiation factor eIF-2B subunit epsilon [Paramarteilia canceri]